jgi:biopolymer transport protein ExbB
MDVNSLAKMLGDACYGFLVLNALWGAYCVIVVWRRLAQLRFRTEQKQAEFLADVDERLDAGDVEGAVAMCDGEIRALPRMVALAIVNRDSPFAKLKQTVADSFQRDVLADLEYRISWVLTVIRTGPLLGLYGTVLGMMAAFGRIGSGEKVKPEQIAAEISIALICTALGLSTAIPFSFLVASINIRVRKLQDMVSMGLTQFLDRFKTAPSGKSQDDVRRRAVVG